MKKATKKQIKRMHLHYFKKALIKNGAPKTITDRQVCASAGFGASRDAYVAGWQIGVGVQDEFLGGYSE